MSMALSSGTESCQTKHSEKLVRCPVFVGKRNYLTLFPNHVGCPHTRSDVPRCVINNDFLILRGLNSDWRTRNPECEAPNPTRTLDQAQDHDLDASRVEC